MAGGTRTGVQTLQAAFSPLPGQLESEIAGFDGAVETDGAAAVVETGGDGAVEVVAAVGATAAGGVGAAFFATDLRCECSAS